MRLLTTLAVTALSIVAPAQEPARFDLLIVGGTVIDGTGALPSLADVGIRGGRIDAIAPLGTATAKRVIDATGLAVAPGFIDVHAHADDIADHPEAGNFLRMGVTTIISGNCGYSNLDLGKTFRTIESVGISLNYGSLIGHGTIRTSVMGRDNAPPSESQLDRMRQLVSDAMQAGAVGMSTGLIYVPGTFAKTEELIALAKEVAANDGVYASHIRNENDQLLEAIEEALRIGRNTGTRVHVSHLKASGKTNWGKTTKAIAQLRAARAGGQRVTADQYAYAAASTSLDILFPAEELSIGRRQFADRLREDLEFRRRMQESLFETMDRVGFGDLSYCRIANAPGNSDLEGMTIPEAALVRFGSNERSQQADLAMTILTQAAGHRVGMIYHTMSETDVSTVMRAPFVAVASDSGIVEANAEGKPHPRGCGNNARVLGHYVRDSQSISLPLAIAKMTSLPATIFRLTDRGRIRVGAWADITVFNPDTVADRATFAKPKLPPDGIPYVIVNGSVAVDEGRDTGVRSGHVIRHPSPAPQFSESHR